VKVAFIFGRFSSCHGSFDIDGLYRVKGLTGSETSFFNAVRGLREMNWEVVVYCDCVAERLVASTLSGATVRQLEKTGEIDSSYDAVLSWNEPHLLEGAPHGVLRVCAQQLNDFDYCRPGFDRWVDLYVFPSNHHRQYMVRDSHLDAQKTRVIPNSINLEFYEEKISRERHRVVYCSSPDRGLHHLLYWFPRIRRRVPEATLRVYYSYQPWYEQTKDWWHNQTRWYEMGFRSRYLNECFRRLGTHGENGIYLVGNVSNVDMANELLRSSLLAYPCDTIRYTEGFSVSIMDACAAGCAPLISDCDSIGSIYSGAAEVIPGNPGEHEKEWMDTVERLLTDNDYAQTVASRARLFAQKFSRQSVAQQWDSLLKERT
jgi:glycosyltransferase involved in cell wall biosynthesis